MVAPKKHRKAAKGRMGASQEPAGQASQEANPSIPSYQKALEMLLNDELSAEEIISIYK